MGLPLLLALMATAAEPAEPPFITSEQVAVMLRTYSGGEQRSAIPFGLAGASGLTAGALLLTGQNTVGRGAAWPLLGFGALEVLAGAFFGLRAGSEQAAKEQLLATDPRAFARDERAHLHRITSRFQPILLIVEGVVTLAGGALATVGGFTRQDALTGVGLGCAVQGLVMFVIDWAVLDRSQAYESALGLFLPAVR